MSQDSTITAQAYSDEQIFYYYSPMNSYIVPYSSDNHGCEVISEFNLKAGLNTLLTKRLNLQPSAAELVDALNEEFGVEVEVDQTTGATAKHSAGLMSFPATKPASDIDNWFVTAYATGTADDTSFSLSLPSLWADNDNENAGSNTTLAISAGKALIYGYYVEASAEILISTSDIMTLSDVAAVANQEGQIEANPYRTKFVKLAVLYTQGPNSRHDERLIPPSAGVYLGVAVVINDDLPASNELLLGTITRDSTGKFFVVNNPLKSRSIPLSSIAGAESYSNLVDASSAEPETVYGVVADSEKNNLKSISAWLWLHETSHLAKLLKAVSVNPDSAGQVTDSSTRGIIVTSDNTGDGRSSLAIKKSLPDFPKLYWNQAFSEIGDASASVLRKDLYFPLAYTDGVTGLTRNFATPEGIDGEPLDATVKKVSYMQQAEGSPMLADVGGSPGLMLPEHVFMLETLYANRNRGAGQMGGRMFGPFLTLQEAGNWFKTFGAQITFELGDYFWVISDTIAADLTETSPGVIRTDYGTITGTVSGNASGTVTGTVDGTSDPTTTDATVISDSESTPAITDLHIPQLDLSATALSGTVTGSVSGKIQGSVTGTLTSFSQNVSTRYVCAYLYPTSGGITEGKKVSAIATSIEWGADQSIAHIYNSYAVDSDGSAVFTLEAVERGFSVPATPTTYGLVKVGNGDVLEEVTLDGDTQRARVSDKLLQSLFNGGFDLSSDTFFELRPGYDVATYSQKKYDSGVTFKLYGKASDWENQKVTLSRIRGHVTLDFSDVDVDAAYQGGLIISLNDVDYVTLHGDNSKTPSTAVLKIGVDHCVVDAPFFTNIGYWVASQFVSGSNTLELTNPWMRVDDVFTSTTENTLYSRFSSITMGESGIVSGMMDIWIQHEGWSDNALSIDRCWTSMQRINFPPMFFEFASSDREEGSTTSGNPNLATIQYIPDNLNLKIGGTAGVHEIWNTANSAYQVSGNLLINLDWEYNGNPEVNSTPAGKLYLNLYMKNSSGEPSQKFSNLRFRAPVQIFRTDNNEMVTYATYKGIYQKDPEN